ncbi:COQ9 family protein [Aurantiacibacter suaedae]|uniref:COQ9 family protein n=1 Tax=Aurantiacibacter suaedae TaxID=2545755 RepID=UPI0010F8DCCA|nr:COQ9 family protein [Aurantiacibacter suaedae]
MVAAADRLEEAGSLADVRVALAPALAQAAVFDGWTEVAVDAAAEAEGVDPAIARLAFADGPMAMIEAFVAATDAAMRAHFADGRLGNMKIRERIAALVRFRLDQAAGLEEALSRALAIQAMPTNAPRALKLGWSSADAMWRLAGDTATDYNHYTKRAILASIYAATLAVFIEDQSEGKAETHAFLDRRIDGVMKFEKVKAQLTSKREHFDIVRFLGRLRYPQS